MGYSGYKEYLCEHGHHLVNDCMDEEIIGKQCILCAMQNRQSIIKYWHSVDTTNGHEPENNYTYPARKMQIGTENSWKEDGFGNKYAETIEMYKPDDEVWHEFKPV